MESDLGEEELVIKIVQSEKTDTKAVCISLLDMECKRMERVKTAYETGVDTLKEYSRKKQEISERVVVLKREIEQAEQTKQQSVTHFKEQLKNILPKLKSVTLCETDKNELLSAIVAKIVYNRTDNTIQIFYEI